MIWPYFTVLVDSFREALASRVLWILLALTTLLLVALAPTRLAERRATDLILVNMQDWDALLSRMKRQANRSEPSPGKHLWTSASDTFRETAEVFLAEKRQRRNQFERMMRSTSAFNELLGSDKFYDEESFADVVLDSQTRKELAEDYPAMTGDARKHFHRRLLRAAFPTETAQMPLENAEISYLWYSQALPEVMSIETAQSLIATFFLPIVMNALVGIFGIFAAILVTAPIIPKTFEAGAIDLLLSKPVSRSLLFLVKFFGGCAYILLVSTYFIVGAWLILGFRMGVWAHSLLYCIPLFLFMFLIYYAVSAFAAVIWRNAIVSVVITILFWGICFSVGFAKGLLEDSWIDTVKIRELAATEDGVMTLNGSSQFNLWGDGQWRAVFPLAKVRGRDQGDSQLFGPVYDAKQQRVAYIIAPPTPLSSPNPLVTTQWTNGEWQTDQSATPPIGTKALFNAPNGDLIAFGRSGPEKHLGGAGFKVFGFNVPVGGVGFRPLIEAGETIFADDFQAAMNATTGNIVVANTEQCLMLERQTDGSYIESTKAPFKDFTPRRAAFGDQAIAIANEEGVLKLLDVNTLQVKQTIQPGGERRPKSIIAHEDRFAILFDDGYLIAIDQQGATLRNFGSGHLAIVFDQEGYLYVADRVDRVTKYNPVDFVEIERWSPAEDELRLAYRYVVVPIYTVFPKPAQLWFVVDFVLNDFKQRDSDNPADIAGPIWSSLAFVVVLLSMTCIYLHRLDI